MEVIIGQLLEGINPAIRAWYQDRTGIAQKLRRLEMLVIKIRSVIEISEKVEIKNENLRKWQQIFKDAATQGDEVRRKLQNQANSSSSSSSSGICTFFERLISRKEDVEQLSSTIEWLEQISGEVKDFLKTLKLELSELVKHRRKLKRGRGADKEIKTDGNSSASLFDQGALFPEWLDTFRVPKKTKAQSRFQFHPQSFDESNPVMGADTAHSDKNPEELAKLAKLEEDESLLADLISGNFEHFILVLREQEEVAVVEDLVASIQDVVDMAKSKGEDGSWFGQWIAKLREAIEDGNSVVSAIESTIISWADEKILDEIGVIVTHDRLRLESMLNDLEDFINLAEVEKVVIGELAPGPSDAP